MDIKQAVIKRHSVRQYKDKEIEEELVCQLNNAIKEICEESGLDIQLILNEPKAFTGPLANYGKFENCKNYITICGKRGRETDVGYYGEKLVILAQMLGLNTCWVALTYSKGKLKLKLKKIQKKTLYVNHQ